jgi:predicted nucleotidyltransferase component of viral defense system
MLRELTDRINRRFDDPQARLNDLREQLQRIFLVALHDARAFSRIAFVGGTCLRIVHGLRRYSEDLDFSLVDRQDYDFPAILRKTGSRLNAFGIEHSVKIKTKNTVHSALIGFPQVRQWIGEHPMASAKLNIKIDVDTRPPEGWKTELHIQRTEFGLAGVTCYDLPSLFAGKLHALCCRKYTKGRDWYDLVWYLTQMPPAEPNLDMLTNAVAQTEGAEAWKGDEWRARLQEKIRELDLAAVKADILPFISRREELDIFSKESLLSLIK